MSGDRERRIHDRYACRRHRRAAKKRTTRYFGARMPIMIENRHVDPSLGRIPAYRGGKVLLRSQIRSN
jgi:hypothetical protein